MNIFNFIGFAFMLLIMVPNIIFSITHKDGFENKFNCKTLETFEQIGRYGSFIFMFINIPYLCFGYFFEAGRTVYILVGSIITLLYCVSWLIFWKSSSLTKAIVLSAVPSLLFLFCGTMQLNIPLILSALIFAPCHIAISVKNALN